MPQTIAPANTVRADNVGSLLRPQYLLDARHQGVEAKALREVEDRAILEALALQEELGLPVVSDGEYRRRYFFSTIEVLVDGIDPTGYVRHHRDASGNEVETLTPTPVARLRRTGTLADYELSFLRDHTTRMIKVAMPSPSLLNVYWKEGVSDHAYDSREDYLEHLIELMNEDAKLLAERGATYIQLDAPHYAYIQKVMADVADRDAKLRELVELDNRVFDGVKGAVTCLHVCRGNDRSHFTGVDPYDDFAASIFPYTAAERLMLEYDDERSGGFAPLRFVREDQAVVLGLITTKYPQMESPDELKRRIDEAAQYVPMERLALSPQCGFASNAEGNEITWDVQRAKLELVLEVARDVWGEVGPTE